MKKLFLGFLLLQLVLLTGGFNHSYARSEADSKQFLPEILHASETVAHILFLGLPSDQLTQHSPRSGHFVFVIPVFEVEEEEEKQHSYKKYLQAALCQTLLLVKSFGLYLDVELCLGPPPTFPFPSAEPDYLVFQVFRI